MKLESLPDRLLLFDGVCNLCNGLVQFTINHDPKGRFKFASLQSEAGQAVLKHFGFPLEDLDTFVYVRDGHPYLKSAAGFYTCRDLGGIWALLFGFMLVPRPIRDFLYDQLAKRRYGIFGKQETCMVPTEAVKERFI